MNSSKKQNYISKINHDFLYGLELREAENIKNIKVIRPHILIVSYYS